MSEKKTNVSRRDFLKLAAAATATGVAASCAPEATPAPTAPPEVKPTEAPEEKPTEAPPEVKPTEAPEEEAKPTEAPKEEPEPTKAPAKPEEVTVTFAGDADVATLCIDTWGSLLAYQVYRAVGLTLVHYKVQEGEDGALYYQPGEYDFVGAESAELAPDLKSATFKVRQGLTFDNGKSITAHEWKKTFDWFYDRQSVGWGQTNANGVEHKDDIQAMDDWTLEMKFGGPTPWAIDGFFILNQAVQDVDEIMSHADESDPYGERWLENNVVCSGAYTIESRTPGEQLVLKARDDWWEGKADIDRIILRVIPDASARFSLLKKGEVDIASMIDWKDLGDLEEDPNVKVERFKTDGWYIFGMHNDMPPGDDVNFRKAVACGVDWNEVVDTVHYGYAQRLYTPFGPFMKGQDPSTWPYTYDPDKAKEYLDKSVCAGGCDIDMYLAEYMPADEKMAVMIKDYLGQIGINMNINMQTGVENWDAKIAKTIPFALSEFYSWIPDAGYHLVWNWQPDSFANFFNYQNPEAAELMEKLIPLAPDDPDRIQMLYDLQVMMAEDVWGIPLMASEQVYPHKPNIHGFAYYPDSNMRWERVYVD